MAEFYFLLDQPAVQRLQNRIAPHDEARPLSDLSAWMVDFAREWGLIMDTTASLTPESLQSFYDAPAFNMQDYMPAPGGWRRSISSSRVTSNRARGRLPGSGDDRAIVSAADSTFMGVWEINQQAEITVKALQWSLLELLDGSPYRDRFNGGIFTHSYLNTYDYHRLHTPVRGRVLESRVIHGQAYFEVKAEPVKNGAGDDGAVRAAAGAHAGGVREHRLPVCPVRGLLVLESPSGSSPCSR